MHVYMEGLEMPFIVLATSKSEDDDVLLIAGGAAAEKRRPVGLRLFCPENVEVRCVGMACEVRSIGGGGARGLR